MVRARLSAALIAALAALALAGCGSPCRDLGNRLCRCAPAGTSRQTCERQVKDELDNVNPSGEQEAFCDGRLALCEEPGGTEFCTWLQTTCGRVSCGLSVETDPPACPAQ